MNSSGGTVLAVARAGVGGHGEEGWAVSHVAGGGDGVGNDTTAASAVDVSAVPAGAATGGRAALRAHAGEDAGNGGAGGGAGGLEELGHLGGRAGRGGVLANGGQVDALTEGSRGGGQAAARAVGLDGSALLVEGDAGNGSLLAVDLSLDVVGLERNGANKLGGVLLSKRESTRSRDVELATDGKVVELGNVEGDLNAVARSDALESILIEAVGGDKEANTIKVDVLAYTACQEPVTRGNS